MFSVQYYTSCAKANIIFTLWLKIMYHLIDLKITAGRWAVFRAKLPNGQPLSALLADQQLNREICDSQNYTEICYEMAVFSVLCIMT